MKTKTTKVCVAGIGNFGSKILEWILAGKMKNIEVLYSIEPKKIDLCVPRYPSLEDVPKNLLKQTNAIIDCSPQGSGKANMEVYKNFGIPAVFQNGESMSDFALFHGSMESAPDRYIKIARCSALSTHAVVSPLRDILDIERIWCSHFKVNNNELMLNMGYASGPEMEALTGIKTKIDVVYLRGDVPAHSYHGFVHLYCREEIPNWEKVWYRLHNHPQLVSMCQTADSRVLPRLTKTLVIPNGIRIEGNMVQIPVLSFTPEINFPENEKAVQLLVRK